MTDNTQFIMHDTEQHHHDSIKIDPSQSIQARCCKKLPGWCKADNYAVQTSLFIGGEKEVVSKRGICLTWCFRLLFFIIVYYAYTTYANVESIEEHYYKGHASPEILENIEKLPGDDHREDICYELNWWWIKSSLTKPYCEDDHLKKLQIEKEIYFNDGTPWT